MAPRHKREALRDSSAPVPERLFAKACHERLPLKTSLPTHRCAVVVPPLRRRRLAAGCPRLFVVRRLRGRLRLDTVHLRQAGRSGGLHDRSGDGRGAGADEQPARRARPRAVAGRLHGRFPVRRRGRHGPGGHAGRRYRAQAARSADRANRQLPVVSRRRPHRLRVAGRGRLVSLRDRHGRRRPDAADGGAGRPRRRLVS